eukprot:Opistho-2@11311
MPTMVDQLAASQLIPADIGADAFESDMKALKDKAAGVSGKRQYPQRARRERVTVVDSDGDDESDENNDGRSESSAGTHESTVADLQGAELLASMFTVSRHNSTTSNDDDSNSTPASPSVQSVSTTKRPSRGKSGSHTTKRVKRLEENRLAARRCREKKKEYVKTLEDRLRRMESWNKNLVSDLQTVQDILSKAYDAGTIVQPRLKLPLPSLSAGVHA